MRFILGDSGWDSHNTNPFLLAEKPVLDELVDHGEDKAVDGGLSGQARPRRQREQDARGQNEEEESSRQKVPHLFAF
jgi:hypothetical protein